MSINWNVTSVEGLRQLASANFDVWDVLEGYTAIRDQEAEEALSFIPSLVRAVNDAIGEFLTGFAMGISEYEWTKRRIVHIARIALPYQMKQSEVVGSPIDHLAEVQALVMANSNPVLLAQCQAIHDSLRDELILLLHDSSCQTCLIQDICPSFDGLAQVYDPSAVVPVEIPLIPSTHYDPSDNEGAPIDDAPVDNGPFPGLSSFVDFLNGLDVDTSDFDPSEG